jgi:predicted TIM-barrel fold metal-dependent hydrolase
MDPVIMVSADSHASMPPALWEEYLEPEFHEHLPRLRVENEVYSDTFWTYNNNLLNEDAVKVFDREGRYAAGNWKGLWDRDIRIAEMDREGVAAEFVFYGDFRTSDLFINVMNGAYPPAAVDAGARAYDRWAYDTFGPAGDRLLITGGIGGCLDRDALNKELRWVADHGFIGTYAPGFQIVPGQPPLDDEYWDPVWATYADLGLALVVHAGWGFPQGFVFNSVERSYYRTLAIGKSAQDLMMDLMHLINPEFFADLNCRRTLWELTLGGVFDRHPNLKVFITECRADWIPATLAHLDEVWAEHRADVPAKRPPSEYWHTNFMVGLSFMHRCEIEMRDEIGVDRILFGRDYPHSESTWPNTHEFLKMLLAGVPESDARKILGENVIEFLGLDRDALAKVAARINTPSIEAITAPGAADEVDEPLVNAIDTRTGFFKPAEGPQRLPEVDGLLQPSIKRMAAAH